MTAMRFQAWAGVLFAVASVSTGPVLGQDGPAVPTFVDETASSGVTTVYDGEWFYMVGGGVAAFDCNADGFADMLLPGGSGVVAALAQHQHRGRPDHLRAGAESGAELDSVAGAYPADIDSDGITDLIVLRVGENVAMRGLGDCKFERANEAWGFDGGDAWSTALAATWEKGAAWPTIAIGNYIDRAEEISPWGSCTDNWLHRPAASRHRLRRAASAEAELLRALDALHRLEPLGHAEPPRLQRPRVLRRRPGADVEARARRRARALHRRRRLEARFASGAWASRATTSIATAIPNTSSPAWPTTSCRRLPTPAAEGGPKPAFKDVAFAKGVTAHRPYTGDDLRPSTAWHAQFEDVNNDGLVDLLVVKGNVAEMPDFAMHRSQQPPAAGRRGQVRRGGPRGRHLQQRQFARRRRSPTSTWTASSTSSSPTAGRARRSGATPRPASATGSSSRSSSRRPTSMPSAAGSRLPAATR